MEINIKATPEEIAKLLQVVGSNLEQKLETIIHNPSNAHTKTTTARVNEENKSALNQTGRIGKTELGI
jgi:hypothetical protein